MIFKTFLYDRKISLVIFVANIFVIGFYFGEVFFSIDMFLNIYIAKCEDFLSMVSRQLAALNKFAFSYVPVIFEVSGRTSRYVYRS